MARIDLTPKITADKYWGVFKIEYKGGYGTASEVKAVFHDSLKVNHMWELQDNSIYTDKDEAKNRAYGLNCSRKEYEKDRRAAYVEYHTRWMIHETDAEGHLKLSKKELEIGAWPQMEIIGTYNFRF